MMVLEKVLGGRLGLRVRAPGDIFYADSGVTIAKGTEGVVQVVTHCGALVGIQWDGDETVARSTSFDSVEIVELKVYKNDVTEWVVAKSPADCASVLAEMGHTLGPTDDESEWEECPLDASWTCQEEEGQSGPVTHTFRKWIALKGRGYLGSTEF